MAQRRLHYGDGIGKRRDGNEVLAAKQWPAM